MISTRLLVVAHRAGNDPAATAAAERLGVDMVEADLHLFGGRVEVRHAKTIGPLPVLWERWHLVRPFRPRMQLAELLASVSTSVHLLLDLKGPWPRLSRRTREILRAAGADHGRRYTVCARNWMLLRPFAEQPGVEAVRSVAGPLQLRLLLRGRRRSSAVSVDQRLLTPQVAAALLARTDMILAWGVATEARLRQLVGLGVRGFILDAGELIRVATGLRDAITNPLAPGVASGRESRSTDQVHPGGRHDPELPR